LFLRLPNERKLPLISAAFLAPLAILYYDTGSAASTTTNIWIACTAAFAVYCMIAFFIQADVGWRLLIGAFKRLEEGDLTAKIDVQMGGHFGIVMRTLEDVNRSLGEIVAQVRASSNAVARAASDIAADSSNLSHRTEQQASTLEETASAMEELASTVRHNADNCKMALQQSGDATRVARQGAEIVHGVVQAMGNIERTSRRMAEIIATIEGIAFQTNILALNAAVEAARAGEQGKGFAVVASEVRSLAQRSAAAAKEIKSLIEGSVEEVSSGGKQAEGAGKAIDDIVVNVQVVNELIGEIASASNQQSAGMGEINRAIVQLESVTQQNAGVVQDAAGRVLSFQDEAARLTKVVSRFRIAETKEGASPAGAARAHQQPPAPSKPARVAMTTMAPLLPARPVPAAAVADHNEWKEF
jgi:methyl-accepting chemotaxis protein